MSQAKRLHNPEGLAQCQRTSCTYPVCHCYDAETITSDEADQLLLDHIEPMLQRLRLWIDDLSNLIHKKNMYTGYAQLRVYRKRRTRLQKNFIFWKIKYDLLKK